MIDALAPMILATLLPRSERTFYSVRDVLGLPRLRAHAAHRVPVQRSHGQRLPESFRCTRHGSNSPARAMARI
jgi:hypothetical protein